jgi:hypothetical protein
MFLFSGCAQTSARVERVVVLNERFEVTRAVEDPEALARFSGLWDSRRETERPGLMSLDFSYMLDITAAQGSGRWLYSPDGLATLLAIKARPVRGQGRAFLERTSRHPSPADRHGLVLQQTQPSSGRLSVVRWGNTIRARAGSVAGAAQLSAYPLAARDTASRWTTS